MRRGRAWRWVILHSALIGGSILFAIPFLWLLGTASKMSAEMYPPRWVPEVPGRVTESPYIAVPLDAKPVRPRTVDVADWNRVLPAVRQAVSRAAQDLRDTLPGLYEPHLGSDALADAMIARLLRRTPDALFEKVDAVAAAWFADQVDEAAVTTAFDAVYQRVALSDVALYGADGQVEFPTEATPYPWTVASGGGTLTIRDAEFERKAQELAYRFDGDDRVAAEALLPVAMAPEALERVSVSVHADRSWHEVWVVVELAGRRYEATEPVFLGTGSWQDFAWRIQRDTGEPIMAKSWYVLQEAGASDTTGPQVRLRFEVRDNGQLAAAAAKYGNNYRDVLRLVPFWRYVNNSVVLVVLNVLGQMLGSSLVAFAFARLRWPGRDAYFVLVLATLMIPPQVTMIPVFLIFKQLGWYNTLYPLWVPAFFGSAFYIFLLRQFMKGIPRDLEDSARIDGCGYAGIYARIILPLIKPALAAIGIFTFMATWNEFMMPLIYLSDQELYPLSLGLFALQAFQRYNYGLMMAASVLMTLPVIAVFFLAQRYFIQGVTLTGLKG